MEQQTFFEQDAAAPLAARLRPQTLEEIVGQRHLLGVGKVLRRLIEGDFDGLLDRPEPFAAEIHALMSINGYRPKAIVEYDRTAFIAKENKTRVTFDRNIRATELNQGLFDPKLPLYPVFDPFNVVLEVKFDGFLLSYIRSMLNMVDKSELSVSKYCLACSVRMAYQF